MTYLVSDVKWGGGDLGTSGGVVTWSFDLGSAFRYDSSTYTLSDFETALQAAFDAWEAVADIDFEQAGAAWQSDIDVTQKYLAGSTVGQAAYSYYVLPGTDQMIEATISFDTQEIWSPYGENGGLDFYAVALHEIGHAIGLEHVNDITEIMNPYVSADTLGDGDIAGGQAIYGAAVNAPEPVADAPPPPPPPEPVVEEPAPVPEPEPEDEPAPRPSLLDRLRPRDEEPAPAPEDPEPAPEEPAQDPEPLSGLFSRFRDRNPEPEPAPAPEPETAADEPNDGGGLSLLDRFRDRLNQTETQSVAETVDGPLSDFVLFWRAEVETHVSNLYYFPDGFDPETDSFVFAHDHGTGCGCSACCGEDHGAEHGFDAWLTA